MPTLTLKIQYNKNEDLFISPTELMEKYLFGIPTCTTDGRKIPTQSIKKQIQTAQKRIENLFSIKLSKQVIEESRNFIRQEFNAWGYVRSMYPVTYIHWLKGYINDLCQINYPQEWLSLKKTEGVAVYRNVHLIPNSAKSVEGGTTMSQHSIIYNGVSPHLGWFGQDYIPNYWRLKYITGWDAEDLPDDLADMVAKFAAINVLSIIGSYLYGVGLSSISISLDGVSQNTPLTKGGKYGMFSDRISLYQDDINQMMESLQYIYRGIAFDVL